MTTKNYSKIVPKTIALMVGIVYNYIQIQIWRKPKEESEMYKRGKFRELANKRVGITIDKLRLVGNLSDNRYYESSDEDVKQILDALSKELNDVKTKFQKKEYKHASFRLRGIEDLSYVNAKFQKPVVKNNLRRKLMDSEMYKRGKFRELANKSQEHLTKKDIAFLKVAHANRSTTVSATQWRISIAKSLGVCPATIRYHTEPDYRARILSYNKLT